MMELAGTPLLVGAALFIGLIIGSFLNVVIYRLPLIMEREWRQQCELLLSGGNAEVDESDADPAFNLAWPASHCPGCKHPIRATDNVPILGYLLQGGRCRHCGMSIRARYPLVEALTGALFALVIWHFGVTPQGLAGLFLTAVLIVLTFIDLDEQLLPDNLTLPLLWAGLLLSLFNVFVTPPDSIIGAAAGYGFLWTVYHGFRLLTGKEGMGHGDFKLLAALGAWMGWQALPLIIVLSSFVGALVGILMMTTGLSKRDQPIPFGPFLAAAGMIAFLYGDSLTELYLSIFAIS